MKGFCARNTRKDHGYSWVVLAASFLSHSMHLGFSFGMVGNITIAHKKLFNIDLQASSWLGSVHFFILFSFAPVASIMIEKLSCQLTQITGGICLILGIGLSAFSTQPWHAYLLYSVLAGWGISATYMATSAVLAHYFDRHKYLAFALAVLGYYIGMTFWPVLSQLLFTSLGYAKAMGIMSTVHIVHVISGILFFPNTNKDSHSENTSTSGTTDENDREYDDEKGISLEEIHNSIKESAETNESEDIEMKTAEPVVKKGLLADAKILLADPKIWALLFNCLFWEFNVGSYLVITNDYMHHYGNMDESQAAVGITILGGANVVGTIAVIATSALDFDRVALHFSCTVVYAIATIITPFTDGTTLYYTMAAVWGLVQGAQIANLLAVVYQFCTVDQLTLLFGVELLSEAIGGLIGAPICGYVQKQTGNPKTGFFVAGAVGLLGALCILPVIIVNARKKKLAEKDTLKALVIGIVGNEEQKKVIHEVEEAAAPEYPHIHKPHLHLHHTEGHTHLHEQQSDTLHEQHDNKAYAGDDDKKIN